MSHSEPAIAGFYDHDDEQRPGRDRPAPDWGGDELFTSTPRRRRFDRPTPSAAPRRRETTEHPVQRPVARIAAAQARVEQRDRHPLLIEEPPAVLEAPREEVEFAPPVMGRRTVTVTGHPEAYVPRRRPARTFDERVVANPERIAGYAFALGILLIVIAFITANA